jgi:MFS transporter, SP family, inositol transporter
LRASAFQSFYQIWSTELFPTSVRATAQGFTFAVVRMGLGIFSFYVPDRSPTSSPNGPWLS